MVTVSYFVHYDTLLLNVTEIITTATAILLQNTIKNLSQHASGFLS